MIQWNLVGETRIKDMSRVHKKMKTGVVFTSTKKQWSHSYIIYEKVNGLNGSRILQEIIWTTIWYGETLLC